MSARCKVRQCYAAEICFCFSVCSASPHGSGGFVQESFGNKPSPSAETDCLSCFALNDGDHLWIFPRDPLESLVMLAKVCVSVLGKIPQNSLASLWIDQLMRNLLWGGIVCSFVEIQAAIRVEEKRVFVARSETRARKTALARSVWKEKKRKKKGKGKKKERMKEKWPSAYTQPSVHSSYNVWNVCISLFPSSELHVGALIRGRDLCVSESEGRKQNNCDIVVSLTPVFSTLLFFSPVFLYIS